MSPNKDEIVKMGAMAKKYNRILSVCHVLRYSPFFSKIKEILDEERIGRMMSIQHIEEVGYWHHAHSFVRGNWINKEESSPMILQKCCHDMDLYLWLADKKCKSLSSFGSTYLFKEENFNDQVIIDGIEKFNAKMENNAGDDPRLKGYWDTNDDDGVGSAPEITAELEKDKIWQ